MKGWGPWWAGEGVGSLVGRWRGGVPGGQVEGWGIHTCFNGRLRECYYTTLLSAVCHGEQPP